MSYSTSVYVFYGVRIDDNNVNLHERLAALDSDPNVRHLFIGPYDGDWHFLAISEKPEDPELYMGTYTVIPPYAAVDETYVRYDWILTDTAQRFGLELHAQPGWVVVPDYS